MMITIWITTCFKQIKLITAFLCNSFCMIHYNMEMVEIQN